jgi:hypothetical protein
MEKKHIIGIVLFLVIALSSIFTIPYLFPPTEISASASYDFGFNNRLGMFLLAFFSLIIFGLSFLKNTESQKTIIADRPSKKIMTPLFFIVTGITIVGCFGLWIIVGSYGIMDSLYFIPHLYDLSFGKKIYQDFEFFYVPVLLYFPYLIYHFFSFLHISISDGYMIALTLNQVLGLYFLQYVLSFFNFTSKERNFIFLFIALYSFPYITGINYTLFRFVLPVFCFMLIRQVDLHKKNTIANILVSILPVTVILTSPELGIALYFTLFVYKGIDYFYTGKKTDLISIGIFILSLFLLGYFLPEMFLGIFGFTSGGMNLPFVFSLPLVLFFSAIFFVSWNIGIQIHDIKNHLFELSFMLLTFAFIPGALGRCDPCHLYHYGLFIFILAFAFIRLYSRKIKIAFGITWAITSLTIYTWEVFVYYPPDDILPNIIKSDTFFSSGIVTLGNIYGVDVGARTQKINERRNLIQNELSENIGNIENITMPFTSNDNETYIFLNKSGKYVSLYYNNPGWYGTKFASERMLKDLKEKQIEFLLLPVRWDYCDKKHFEDNNSINPIFCTRYTVQIKRNGSVIYSPLINFIQENYEYDRNIGEYLLYKKIN